jgi:hypothetical protein
MGVSPRDSRQGAVRHTDGPSQAQPLKAPPRGSDIPNMMISERQAKLALDYLRRTQASRRIRRAADRADISPELMARVMDAISDAPDLRAERIEVASEVVRGQVTAELIADKMIGRLISDELV